MKWKFVFVRSELAMITRHESQTIYAVTTNLYTLLKWLHRINNLITDWYFIHKFFSGIYIRL